MNPIPCLLIDDELPALELLAAYVKRTPGLQLVLQTTDPALALTRLQQGFEGIVFLDVEMPGISGISLITQIDKTRAKIVLTTAYPQYALEGFEHEVLDYLLKPVTFERFSRSVAKAKQQYMPMPAGQADYLFIKVEYRLQKIDLAAIRYIEGLRDYIAFHTSQGKFLSLDHLKNMEQRLPAGFIRIHKSFIVNTSQIDYIERGRIVIGGQYLPIGETYKDEVLKKLGL